MSNATDNPKIEVLKAGGSGVFTNYIYKAIPLAFDESMSYYETLAGLRDYLEKTVIPTVNNNAEAVAELQSLYEELNKYVDDYFKNLDVQEEINNKLDDLVADGTLTRLIGEYIQPLIDEQNELINKKPYYFSTLAEMKLYDLKSGDYAITEGYYEANDGGEATYKITNSEPLTKCYEILNNGLYAELLYNDEIVLNQLGAKINDNTYDCYDIYELAISKGAKKIKLLTGNYYFSRLILHNGVDIIGNGFNNTILNAIVSDYNYFICLDRGPIINCNIKDFRIVGNNNNVNQTGLYIFALPNTSGYQHGGLWNSLLENLYVEGFTKNQIYIEGNDVSLPYRLPNQFNTFNNIYAKGNENSEDVVVIKSQFAQAIFNNCLFENAKGNFYNLKLENCDAQFNSFTCQSAKNGIYLKGGNIEFNKIWLENITDCLFTTDNSSTSYGGVYTIMNGSSRNCCVDSNTYGFYLTPRTILTLINHSFLNSCLKRMCKVSTIEATTYTDFKNCYYSTAPEDFYSLPYDYIQATSTGNVTIKTNRISRIDASPSTDNVINDITFGGWIKGCEKFNCFSHSSITFSGSKFVNPQTIPANKNFVLMRLNSYQPQESNNFDKIFILYQ